MSWSTHQREERKEGADESRHYLESTPKPLPSDAVGRKQKTLLGPWPEQSGARLKVAHPPPSQGTLKTCEAGVTGTYFGASKGCKATSSASGTMAWGDCFWLL